MFLMSSISLSQEMRGLCFNRATSLKEVKSYVSKIISRHDKVLLNNSKHCVELIADSKRMDLFDKFISMNYSVIGRYGDTSAPTGKECLFEIERVKKSNKKTQSYNISKNPSARENNLSSSSKSVSTLRVLESKTAQLYVNEILITLTCRPKGKITVVDISLGSKRTNVITSVEVRKGQRVDLASVVDDLSSKNRGIDISTGNDRYQAGKSKSTGKRTEDFFLTLK